MHLQRAGAPRHSRAVSYTIDEGQRPILITTWVGETTLADALAFNAWLDKEVARARSGGGPIALITDTIAVTRTLPDARKAFNDASISNDIDDVVVGTWVVSSSVVMRGVMAAARWAVPKLKDIHMVATLDVALAAARAALDARSLAPRVPRPQPASRRAG